MVNLKAGTVLSKVCYWPGVVITGLGGWRFAGEWRQILARAGSDIEALAGTTEGEFLHIGEKLQGFYARTQEISQTSSTVADLMSGKELEAVVDGFRDTIDTLQKAESESRRNTETLRNVQGKLADLDSRVDAFSKTFRSLRVLCIFIRIESAGLGDRDPGFQTVADEVGKLSSEIEEQRDKLLLNSKNLNQLIEGSLSKLVGLEITQQKQAGIVIDKTMSGLESIRKQHELSSAAAGRISTSYEEVSRRIGEIVFSLQIHDITRQRLEHVQQALFGLASDSQRRPDGWWRRLGFNLREVGARTLKGLHLAADVSALQTAQLNHARSELVSAVKNILDNLHTLADLVAEITRETSMLAGTVNENKDSFLSEVEEGFSSASSALKVYGEAGEEVSQATGSVADMLKNMSAHAGHIESIGAKIKLIALNAIVKSNHIGSEGATLGILADEIHHLSIDTCKRTEKSSEAIRAIISSSESLYASAEEKETGNEIISINAGLGTNLKNMHEVNRNIFSLLTRIDALGDSLSADLRGVIDEVGVHGKMERVIDSVVSGLEKIVAFSRSAETAAGKNSSVERMKELEAAYTMSEEREIHSSLMEPKTDCPLEQEEPISASSTEEPPTGSEFEQADEESLGDNVELF